MFDRLFPLISLVAAITVAAAMLCALAGFVYCLATGHWLGLVAAAGAVLGLIPSCNVARSLYLDGSAARARSPVSTGGIR